MTDIIVVDDDFDIVDMLTDLLTGVGHQFRTAGNGLQALNLVIARRPRLLLVDIMMPVMNGLTLCRYLKRDPHLAKIPVVIMSTVLNKPLINVCDHQGFLDKPFHAETLLTLVHSLVGEVAS